MVIENPTRWSCVSKQYLFSGAYDGSQLVKKFWILLNNRLHFIMCLHMAAITQCNEVILMVRSACSKII